MHLTAVPGVAQLAIQSGRFAARVITARLAGRQPATAFTYRDKGSLATISKYRAVARIGRIRLGGSWAWLLWAGVHLFSLNGYRNRVSVVLRWGTTFLLNSRADRSSTPVQARHGAFVDVDVTPPGSWAARPMPLAAPRPTITH